jgi:hypothetical protein
MPMEFLVLKFFCYLKDILIILQAEVSAPANTEEANRPDYVLNKYDYFGYGNTSLYMLLEFLVSSFIKIKQFVSHALFSASPNVFIIL